MIKNLEWRHLRGLQELYVYKKTKLRIDKNNFIRQVLMKQKKLIKPQMGNHTILTPTLKFRKYYEENLLDRYNYYNDFFDKSGLENNARKTFTEDDLKALMFTFYNKETLKESLTTEYTFSTRVFKGKGAKYMGSKPALRNAVLDLLDIKEFPEKDPKNNQWRIIVDCQNPKIVVLCENIACLKVPIEYKSRGIKLWYTGGNNTRPLKDLGKADLELPIYYFCDWDYHGLSIFERVHAIFESKKTNIKLVTPLSIESALPTDSPNHNSKWRIEELSKLNTSIYNEEQIKIIKNLIYEDKWIEEEGMDLIDLLLNKGIILNKNDV